MARKLRPKSRVAFCHRQVRDRMRGVDVVQRVESGETAYKGLQVCGLLWECPLCASRITTRRRAELLSATAKWKESGGLLYHLVLTIPHHAGDRCSALRVSFNEARRRVFNRKTWKTLSRDLAFEYTVTCREVTWGCNGWHIHSHTLIFARGDQIDCESVGDQVFELWRSACMAVGLPEPTRSGVHLSGASGAAAYLSKWGIEDELTRSHIKRGREGHFTPWDFLRLYDETGEQMWGSLFTEYCEAMRGSRQLVWSDGLRRWAGLGKERTDLQLATDEEASCRRLGNIPYEIWSRVLKLDARYEVLRIAESQGWSAVEEFLSSLMVDVSSA